jgi:S-adenosylmethionine:tRNA ribosyltransferase-isomerase
MHPRELAIADYTYALPEDRIAQQPLPERDASRLLVYRDGAIADHVFRELPGLLPAGSLLVLNDTRVVNARLVFHRASGARIEVLCLAPAGGGPVEEAFAERGACAWSCFAGNAKRWKAGEALVLKGDGCVLSAERTGTEEVAFRWEPAGLTFAEVLDRLGHVPLPPYMKRADAPADRTRYNTVFARNQGSVAAPTASLHFTSAMLAELEARGIDRTALTLHVGAGTFLPVKSERMAGHAMHSEQVRIPREALQAVAGRLGRHPVVAVGTTALRTLESVYWHGLARMRGAAGPAMDVPQWAPYGADALPAPAAVLQAVIDDLDRRGEDRLVGRTQLLIAPGYPYRFADALVTNFHQPQSTLLLLVAAFVGPDWRRIYRHALEGGYRFLSYGDGSLLWRAAVQ